MPAPTGQITGLTNPIMFVTQVPTFRDFAARMSTFGNHMTGVNQVARGGDLMIRYPDGTLRNLTREAGWGQDGSQAGPNAIAVREPSVHWDGTRALFSMLIGGPTVNNRGPFFWQIYEVTGFGRGETVNIRRIPGQPSNNNNVSPFYAATSDRILFTSDRPHNGEAHLYPPLDEYESTPTVSGIWSLDPLSGNLNILNHSPSGAFSPTIDSFGRVIFTRWDHLQRDQMREPGQLTGFTFAGEQAAAARTDSQDGDEIFPERRDRDSNSTAYGLIKRHTYNIFTPWQMRDDGTDEETLNHVGRHELNFNEFLQKTFADDGGLSDSPNDAARANNISVHMDGGLFHLREDPRSPGDYLGIMAREFGNLTSSPIVRVRGRPDINGDQVTVTSVTPPDGEGNSNPGGRYRNPAPLSTGGLVATHTPTTISLPTAMTAFRLRYLTRDASGAVDNAASAPFLVGGSGIPRTVTWFDPDNFTVTPSFTGNLWELEPVEVVSRTRPGRAAGGEIGQPEISVFTDLGVNMEAFQAWMRERNLALIVSRNVTSRDNADTQQPYNLEVAGGNARTVKTGSTSRVYQIKDLQIFQADHVRGYASREGRRAIPRPMHSLPVANPNAGSVPGSVAIAADGSTAALVPARKALTWQLTDPTGEPVVRERVWVTMQPGEVRVCATCHGSNNVDQAGRSASAINNPPQALRQLLTQWRDAGSTLRQPVSRSTTPKKR
jgi:mono/diheme cytochrome c family protein